MPGLYEGQRYYESFPELQAELHTYRVSNPCDFVHRQKGGADSKSDGSLAQYEGEAGDELV